MEFKRSRIVVVELEDDLVVVVVVVVGFKTEIGLLMTSIGRRIFASAAKIAFSIDASVNVEDVVVEVVWGEFCELLLLLL
jgi:hypothetical protein